jgi:DNA-binding response OmpR family regulator
MEFSVNGSSAELSKAEQKLLRLLIQNKGQTLTRDFLVDRIWTDGAEYVDENALSVTVGRLRKKLNAAGHIQTVYGIGYAWRAE